MKYVAYFALVSLVALNIHASEPAIADEPVVPATEMEILLSLVQANAEAIAAISAQAQAIIPATTHTVVNIPPAPQIVEATSPQSFAVNHEARVAGQIYVTEIPTLQQVITREMPVPAGYQMIRVQQPPRYQVSEYAQPDTFEIQPIAQPVTIQSVTITAAQEGAILSIVEDGIKYIGEPK